MMHLEAIKERNRKPQGNVRLYQTIIFDVACMTRAKAIQEEAVSPAQSIDAAPLPEYQRDRA